MLLYDVCVIGGGAAGVMATLRTTLNNDSTIFFPGTKKDRKRSRERWVKRVENMPAHLNYKRGIIEPNEETLKWLSEESEFKEKLTWVKDCGVTSLKKDKDFFQIVDSEENIHHAKYVILCTGVMDVQPVLNDSIRDILPFANKQTADYCLRCDGHHVIGKELAVIGHSDVAAWTAVILHERYQCPNITILTNGQEPEFKESTQRLVDLYKIDVLKNEITQVLGEVKTGRLDGFSLSCGTSIPAEISFISLGMLVYNKLAVELGANVDERGFVLTDESGETNVEGLFVAGDLRAGIKKQIYTAWDSAVDSADKINRSIRSFRREKLLE